MTLSRIHSFFRSYMWLLLFFLIKNYNFNLFKCVGISSNFRKPPAVYNVIFKQHHCVKISIQCATNIHLFNNFIDFYNGNATHTVSCVCVSALRTHSLCFVSFLGYRKHKLESFKLRVYSLNLRHTLGERIFFLFFN